MLAADGVGLAGPQIGRPLRVIVVRGEDDSCRTLVNPKIVAKSGSEIADEGCLSLPGWFGPVERATEITVRAASERGAPLRFVADGQAARIIQHEIDHLDGVMFTDRIADDGQLRFVGTVIGEEAVPA